MAENDQPFDEEDDFDSDEFDTDFDPFDTDDDFDFEDADEASFQFDEADAETPEELDATDTEDTPLIDEEDLDEDAIKPSSGNFIDNLKSQAGDFFTKLKHEEPKQLIKYGIGVLLALLFVIGGLIKIFSGSPAPTAQTATKPKLTTQQIAAQNKQTPTLNNLSTTNNASPDITPVTMPADNTSLGDLPATSGVATPQPVAITQPTATALAPTQQPQYEQNDQQLETQNADLVKRVSDLEMQIGQLNSQLSAATQMNTSNQAQISSLIKSIDNMQTQMAKLNNAMQVMVHAVGQTNNSNTGGFINPNGGGGGSAAGNINTPDYYVQAVIPGRAWLKNADGQILTVTQGDPVPGYGTVSLIDAQNGIVMTSTGVKFAFGIDAK